MSTKPTYDLREELRKINEQIASEWLAFQIAHKIKPKPQRQTAPQNHSAPYGQNKLWTQSDHIADSQRLNEIDRNKP